MGLAVGKVARECATEREKHVKRFIFGAEFRNIHFALNARFRMSEDESTALIALAVKFDADPHPVTPVIVTKLDRVLRAARAI